MRNFKGISLIVLLFMPVLSTYCLFEIREHQIEKEVKHRIIEGMAKEDLTLLKITEQEKQSDSFEFEHSKEFHYKGKMYDIVSSEQHGDTSWYWCFADEKESALFTHFHSAINNALGNDPVNKSRSERLSQFLSSLFMPWAFVLERPLLIPIDHSCIHKFMYFPSVELIPQSPPPKV